MAPVLPTALAAAADDAGFLSLFTALAVALLTGGAWLLARRRSRAASVSILVLGAALVVASFLPPPATDAHGQVTGFLTGEARIPVRAEAGAPVHVEGGEGRLDGEALVLSCATRCTFRLGAEPAWGAQGGATVADDGESLIVDARGGPLQVRSVESRCQRLPLLVAWMAGGDPCLPCRTVEYLTGAGAEGTLRLTASPAPAC